MLTLLRLRFLHSLSKEEALRRSSCFYPSNSSQTYHEDTIKYSLNLALHAAPKNFYDGVLDLNFNLQQTNHVFLDFSGKTVHNLIINQKQVSSEGLIADQKIQLPQKYLKKGLNHVCVKFQNQYDKDGSGCVSFIDVDKQQYLYTQFQPYFGNRVFPMFDQPDLKAKMQLEIACPDNWETVLSNQTAIQNNQKNNSKFSPVCQLTKKVLSDFKNNLPQNYRTTSFPLTKLLPTYLFCFVVGPYQLHTIKNTYRNIPMNLYCIKSLYPYMMALTPFIKQITNLSMQHFQQYFGYPYPFSKYDQVFAHEYKWGAMQNAGIVTLNDQYIFKDPVSVQRMIGFGNTIVHELAHHWFGNLVTMKWWDDLWLNQSFAEYISHFCLQKIKDKTESIKYESAMSSFLNRKGWGYAQDQLETTHPIRSDVANTQVAQSIFDGITYSKGAATMKQLMYLMGEKQFSNALRDYFHHFAYRNAQLEDLLKYMDKYYQKKEGGVTVQEWREMWLEKAGLNVLEHQLDLQREVLIIRQSAYHANHQTLRSHAIKIAIIRSSKQINVISVTVQPKQVTQIKLTKQQLQNFKNSSAILLNHDDLTFSKIIIDSKSIKYFQKHLNQIEDVLLRTMVWKNFYDMVKDGNLKSTEYIKILVNNLFQQKSDAIFQQNLNYAVAAVNQYTPFKHRSDLLSLLRDACLRQNNLKGTNRAIILKDKLISFSNLKNKQHMQLLRDWYYDKKQTANVLENLGSANVTQKWKLVIKVLSSTVVSKQQKLPFYESMLQNDKSDVAHNKKLTCDGLLMDGQNLNEHFNKHTASADQKWGMTAYIHSLTGINSRIHQFSLRKEFKDKYFQILKVVLSGKQHNYHVLKQSEMIQMFIDHMDPNIEDSISDLEDKVKRFSEIQVHNNDKIKIQIRKKVDMLKKRIKCWKLYQ